MKPMGRKPIKFPSKEDSTKNKKEINWWEYECKHGENKKGERKKNKQECKKSIGAIDKNKTT